MKTSTGKPVDGGLKLYEEEDLDVLQRRFKGLCGVIGDGGLNGHWAAEEMQRIFNGKGGVFSISSVIDKPGEIYYSEMHSHGIRFRVLENDPDVPMAGLNLRGLGDELKIQVDNGYVSTGKERLVAENLRLGSNGVCIDYARTHVLSSPTKRVVSYTPNEIVYDFISGGYQPSTFWEALACVYHLRDLPVFWKRILEGSGCQIVFGGSMLSFSPEKFGSPIYYAGLKMMWSNGASKRVICPVLIPIHQLVSADQIYVAFKT